ncbi:hypothetical protein IAU60_004359 [Kwoniella sp. DSM 27419]
MSRQGERAQPARLNNPGITLKQLLKSSDVLLRPPAPLPSNPPDLLQRLRQCSRSLPKDWRRRAEDWLEEDETEAVGDTSTETDGFHAERRKARRDELVLTVGKRCFILTQAMQQILEQEFWPDELRTGHQQDDCR